MLCATVFVVLSIVAAFGFARVKVDDSLSQLFRSDTEEFRTYEEVTRRFPSNEFDILIVIEGDRLLERSSLEKLRDLAIELQLIDGTRGLISIFSAREPPRTDKYLLPCFPTRCRKAPSIRRLSSASCRTKSFATRCSRQTAS